MSEYPIMEVPTDGEVLNAAVYQNGGIDRERFHAWVEEVRREAVLKAQKETSETIACTETSAGAVPMSKRQVVFTTTADLTWSVAEYLDKHPKASGNKVHKLLLKKYAKAIKAL